jgi:peptide chain release factor 2
LNGRAEDPAIWNDPPVAQKLMRERQRLEESISAVRQLENALSDTVGLIDLAQSENDAAMIADGEASLAHLSR